MKVLQLSFDMQPLEGVDKLQVMYYGDKGWFIHFHMGKDAMGSPKQYTIFNGFVIYGGFGLINAMKMLRDEDYLYKSYTGRDADKVIDNIEKITIDDYKLYTTKAVNDHPLKIDFNAYLFERHDL